MRNVPIDAVDGLERDVLAIGTDYEHGRLLEWHEHRRAQFLYAASGVMLVETREDAWTVPTDRAVLIPPRTRHQVRMLGVSTRSLYIEPEAVPWFPRRCEVVEVTPLLRELLLAAVAAPADDAPSGRDGAVVRLLLHEIADRAPVPLHVPMPTSAGLDGLCRAYLREPDASITNAAWAAGLHVSERDLSRRFRAETGTSPSAWRLRARLLAALPPLAAGVPVARVAVDLGYASPAAFTAAFSRTLGAPPSRFSG